MEHTTNSLRSFIRGGVYRPGEVSVQRERKKERESALKMAPPAFKGCLGDGVVTSYADDRAHACMQGFM